MKFKEEVVLDCTLWRPDLK